MSKDITIYFSSKEQVISSGAAALAAAFDYALERMAELCRQAEQKRDAQSRLFASLGALSGACALMILW